MSEAPKQQPGDPEGASEPSEDEILGRLPRTRPGRRSPRREDAARRAARGLGPTESAARAQPGGAKGAPQAGGRGAAEEHGEGPGAADALAGVAKAGVEIAGGAVGLGFRAAGGALRALRGRGAEDR